MAKTYTCKNCYEKSDKIGVTSECTQQLTLADDNWSSPDVGNTLHGYCLVCGARIPAKDLKRLTGQDPLPDYKAVLETLVNDVETAGCEDCGTVSLKSVNEARRVLNMEKI